MRNNEQTNKHTDKQTNKNNNGNSKEEINEGNTLVKSDFLYLFYFPRHHNEDIVSLKW